MKQIISCSFFFAGCLSLLMATGEMVVNMSFTKEFVVRTALVCLAVPCFYIYTHFSRSIKNEMSKMRTMDEAGR